MASNPFFIVRCWPRARKLTAAVNVVAAVDRFDGVDDDGGLEKSERVFPHFRRIVLSFKDSPRKPLGQLRKHVMSSW